MFAMHFEGGAELAQALDSLSVRVTQNVAREALKHGGELIRKRASQLAPYEVGPPDLRDNIGMSNAKVSEAGDIAAIKIGPTRGFAYGLPQELGTRHHAAQPFMRPAFDTEAPKALGLIGQELWRQLAGRGFVRTGVMESPVQSMSSLL
jgi:HK97 gp10 family phage protein